MLHFPATRTDAPVLICFPHAGGSAGFFRPLAAALEGEVEVVAVQPPGRQDRHAEPPLQSIAELVDEVLPTLRRWTSRPVALFGHSMGAVVGFEVARRLEQEGTPVRRLLASARRAPSRHRIEVLHQQSDAVLLAELRQLGGPHSEILDDQEQARALLPVIRSDYRAIETYRCGADVMLDCPISVFAGNQDPRVGVDDLEAWRGHTRSGCDIRTFDGGHFYLAERVRPVARVLRATVAALAR
ncbi:thioesterase II family protein [Nocardia sp. NPDC056000]|uniref:thioesterase II family protein n=1 Tax=Nocardia sp. NPDC056000 TaxID=3345674 RepID=UPI0035E08E6A